MFRAVSLNPSSDARTFEPRDLVELEEAIRAVRDQLARLAPHLRDAIEARGRLVSRSYRDVAAQYGVSRQTVCNWADVAERELRRALEGFR